MENSIRIEAIIWWDSLSISDRLILSIKVNRPSALQNMPLTGREIEELYIKEQKSY